jgi:hypothetical protein
MDRASGLSRRREAREEGKEYLSQSRRERRGRQENHESAFFLPFSAFSAALRENVFFLRELRAFARGQSHGLARNPIEPRPRHPQNGQ